MSELGMVGVVGLGAMVWVLCTLVLTFLLAKYSGADDGVVIALAVSWPLLLAFSPVLLFIRLLDEIIDRVRC